MATFEQEATLNSSEIPLSQHTISLQPISSINKKVRQVRKIAEPALKEMDTNRTTQTLFEAFNLVNAQWTPDEKANDEEVVFPTQVQKKAKYV
jgi:hypothetical protein